jgi:hypothetical protein
MRAELFPAGMKAQRDDGGGRILLGEAAGHHAAADRVPLCWSLDFRWTPLHTIHIRTFGQMYAQFRIAQKNRLASDIPERSNCVSRSVCVRACVCVCVCVCARALPPDWLGDGCHVAQYSAGCCNKLHREAL